MRETNRSLTNLTQTKGLEQRERLQEELDDIRGQLQARDKENAVSTMMSQCVTKANI